MTPAERKEVAAQLRLAAQRIERQENISGVCAELSGSPAAFRLFAETYREDSLTYAGISARWGYWMANVGFPERDPITVHSSTDEEVRNARVLALCFLAAAVEAGDIS